MDQEIGHKWKDINQPIRIGESAEQGTGAQPFRCNYDMRNGEASGYVNHFVGLDVSLLMHGCLLSKRKQMLVGAGVGRQTSLLKPN